jgi:dTDP-4-amino-4,6-dideoxygalactose transaminase
MREKPAAPSRHAPGAEPRPASGMRVPFVRPALPDAKVLLPVYEEILASRQLTKGPYLERFERAIAERLGVKHAVAVSSCTVGLMLVYKVLDLAPPDRAAGIGEVIMPSFTFLAAPAAPVWNNLRPVFVEVDPRSTNVVPEAVAAAITPRTVAISACHNFGNPCDVAALEAIAQKHGLKFVIDAAHGFGALLHGKPVGKGGTAQVFSLSPTKLLVAGEGGIVATDSDELARGVRIAREYGNDGSYDAVFPGVNGRMPELSAATALASLEMLDDVAARRRAIAAAYRRGLAGLAGIGCMEETPGSEPSYKDFSITIDPDAFGCSRDRVRGALAASGIETRAYYDPPCHRQRAFARFHDPRRPLPVTDMLASRSLSLPIGEHVDESIVAEVCEVIGRASA